MVPARWRSRYLRGSR
ncbi:hypothetical protein E2C01_081418 [Portunus trituberculatus]|uniref:Uncharacterized protein n=1 Tax=Portunus trituberculatus TaxID=210409 RepID=A0A5B7J296_PORTR|nr:hypothetical protein [Portunus trituberculatus]